MAEYGIENMEEEEESDGLVTLILTSKSPLFELGHPA